MNINLNQAVSVTLTATGAALHNAWEQQFKTRFFEPKTVEAGYVLRAQLWSLFQVFGPSIHLGCGEVPFVDCKIEIEGRLL